MIRCADEDDVQILFLEHFAVIVVDARFLFGCLAGGNGLSRLSDHLFIHVAKRNDLHGSDLDGAKQITLAIPAAADQANAFLRIGQIRSITSERGESQSYSSRLEEVPAV